MNATPKTAARQTRVARQQQAERARVQSVAPHIRLAYSTKSEVK